MPKGRVSNVWQHYDINEECENFAICRYCGNNISRGGMASNLKGNNTTNLWTHLRHKHRDEVLVSPVQQRPQARMIPIIKKGNSSEVRMAGYRPLGRRETIAGAHLWVMIFLLLSGSCTNMYRINHRFHPLHCRQNRADYQGQDAEGAAACGQAEDRVERRQLSGRGGRPAAKVGGVRAER